MCVVYRQEELHLCDVCRQEEELYRGMISGLEERQQQLVVENSGLRQCLRFMQRELNATLATTTSAAAATSPSSVNSAQLSRPQVPVLFLHLWQPDGMMCCVLNRFWCIECLATYRLKVYCDLGLFLVSRARKTELMTSQTWAMTIPMRKCSLKVQNHVL